MKIFRAFFSLILVLFLTSCKVENQKTNEIFADNILPRTLYRIANQIYEMVSVESDVVRTSQECSPDCLDVAVIDAGVDLAHPDLVSKIRFNVQDNRLAGAGYDFLGNDEYASSNLIDPTLFSFGAAAIENGRIKNPPENPLDLIVQYNTSFMTALMTDIQFKPELKGTLFDNLSAKHTSLYELHKMIIKKAEFLKDFETRKKVYGLLKRGDLPKLEQNPKTLDPAIFHLLETNPWRTFVPGQGTGLEGFDVLLDLVEKNLKTFPDAAAYESSLSRLVAYLDGRDFDESTSVDSKYSDSLDKVQKALDKKLYGHLFDDYIYNMVLVADMTQLQESWLRKQKIQFPASPRSDYVREHLQNSYKSYGHYLEYASKLTNLTLSEKLQAQEAMKSYQKFVKLSKWLDEDRKIYDVPTYTGYKPNFDSHLYRKRFARTSHPFISSKSADQSHGSHVSGIILSQNENLKIVPVRVSTESLQLPRDIRNEYVEKFRDGFQDWLQKPLVFRALGNKMSKWFPNWNFSDSSDINRVKVATEIVELLDDSIKLSVDEGLLDHVFIEEIVKAVRYVGSQKIKVANISLGTNFERPSQRLGEDNPIANLKNFFAFLKFEYFKYRIGEEIRASAMETVFVVAAGNESTWVDGRSRSALPVDISSPFLMPFERPDRGEVAPNNGLKNIIAVGSLSKDDELSNYTNIFLGKHVPFVFARGEMILSSIKSTDTSGITQALSMWEPNLNSLTSLGSDDDRLKPYFAEVWKKMRGTQASPSDDQLQYLRSYFNYSMIMVLNHSRMINDHLAVKFSEHRAVMSGTSMASPAVAGALGKLVIEKKKSLGLERQDIYTHPSFKAENLVQELLSKTEPIDPNNNVYGLKKLIGTLEMADKDQELDKFLRNL
jgi:subtilisin family serine protease